MGTLSVAYSTVIIQVPCIHIYFAHALLIIKSSYLWFMSMPDEWTVVCTRLWRMFMATNRQT